MGSVGPRVDRPDGDPCSGGVGVDKNRLVCEVDDADCGLSGEWMVAAEGDVKWFGIEQTESKSFGVDWEPDEGDVDGALE
jgi:hypothetical protein